LTTKSSQPVESSQFRGLRDLLERAGLPLVTIPYALAIAIWFRDALDKLGWRILSLTVLLACVAWLVYTFVAKRPNLIDPSHLQSTYGRATRIGALAAVLIATIPATYAILPSGPRVPLILFKAINNSSSEVKISPFAGTFFTVADNPVMDRQIESGRMRLYTGDQKKRDLSIPPHSEAYIFGRFLNEDALVPLFDRGDVALSVVLTTSDGRFFRRDGIPFNREDITSGYIELQFD